ncbi:MAG TPA: aldo/keto reductase, partial [Mycobacteriales bacterium]|nr:aldo/keto reductase [Mycobacteriales bacterium]
DAGINFVDTADVYAAGQTEEILGRALKGRRDNVVLATKFHQPMGPDPNERGNSRRWIVRAVEGSLRRLQTDWIDLYQVHRPDPDCDIDQTLSALTDLVRQGKVRAIGTSTFPAEQIVHAQWVAERRQRERFVAEQAPYSLFTRAAEASVLPTCQQFDVGVVVWSPLNGGWLTGKYRRGADLPAGSRAARHPDHFDGSDDARVRKFALVERLLELSEHTALPVIQLALAFVLEHPAVSSAIIGPRTLRQLLDQLPAADVQLEPAVLDQLDAVVPAGTNVTPTDVGWTPPALEPAARRRPRP